LTTTTVSPRYRITIPKNVREESNLKIGDQIAFLKKGDELILVKIPKRPLSEMAGALKTKKNVRKALKQLKVEELEAENLRGK
jgi:AbrB family looped-hinge helix DNA binding protein